MNGLLVITLQVAVPLWIHEVAKLTQAERLAAARECGQMIAEHGDDIIYLSPRKGETARAFNALARGLACAAYQPGGVWFMGTHFCTDHSVCEAAEVARR
jgi:hypothetical protein